MVEYTYDPWGACTIVSDSTTFNLSTLNPFRYRGYYYDEETGLYYLQSRYYDPATCKFINADDPSILLVDPFNVMSIYNYDYCGFNPVMYIDPEGYGRTYVIYYNYPGRGFNKQARNSPYYNINSKNTYLISVVSVKDFINAWNSMSGTIDYVYLYLHGGTGLLYFRGESLGFTGSTTFSKLKKKTVKIKICLFSCYGGAGKEGNNVAWMFAKLANTKVSACTGSVSYSKIFGKYIARKAWDTGIFKTFYYGKKYVFWGKTVAKSSVTYL